MMSKRVLLLVAIFAGVGARAQAEDSPGPASLNLGRMTAGYSYYNRPRADMSLHNADVAACLADAANMRSFQEQLRGGMGGLLGQIIAGAQADSANRGVVSASLENCMVVRGWRVFHLDDVEGKQISLLPAEQLATTLAPWIGAENPHGTVVREWHNDAALGAVNHFSLHAQHTKNGQLSLLALATSVSQTLKRDEQAGEASAEPGNVALDPRWSKKPVKPEMLDGVPADAAIFIVNVTGFSMRQGNGFVFSRVGADGAARPSVADHGPDLLYAFASTLAGGGEGKTMAFAVPPGKWRIQEMSNGGIELNFCLGAPAFVVKAGEVAYVGRLDMKAEKMVPDMSLDRVRTWMAGTRAADRVTPVAWTNGSRAKCAPNSIYALEFDGAPFERGYELGSRVSALPAR
ncbi:MAG: hypothetical protein JWL96_1454 [Sphingomonas bacterium]|uniref:hypothetical protein n=1 Tax=Sphingomonas bacterium TaxID=1895847 RepID=UPI00262C2D6D|nr:hypothetical protein [Sphingomonas bacterium]MDB5709384.1 hypothetical protein [Sphingomonas bacterium]